MHFAITIDTEIDKSNDWSVSKEATFEGVICGVQEILHPLFISNAVKPVYFLSNEILADSALSSIFKKYQNNNTAELGTHLHYEAAGPFKTGDIAGRKLDGVQAQLSRADERLALKWLTDMYQERFSRRPISFRAGRYGLGPNSIGLLAEMGYKVDSSVTPGLLWEYGVGEIKFTTDYRHAPTVPYECDSHNPSMKGESGILQIPISLEKAPLSVYEMIRLLLGKKRRWVWARPGFASKAEFLKLIKTAAVRQNKSDIIVMMFHNMEVIPGKSPYCLTEKESTDYIDELTFFIKQANYHGLSSITLEDYAKLFSSRLF